MPKMNEAELFDALEELGFSPYDFQKALHGVSSVEEARGRLAELKQRIHRAAKRKRLELHPDRHLGAGQQQIDEMSQQLSRITDVLKAVDTIEIGTTRRRALHPIAVTTVTTTDTGTAVYTDTYWPQGANPFKH